MAKSTNARIDELEKQLKELSEKLNPKVNELGRKEIAATKPLTDKDIAPTHAFSLVERTAIKALYDQGMDIKDIARELKKPKPAVLAFLNEMVEKENQKLGSAKDGKFINRGKSGKAGIAVMTEAGSAKGDPIKDGDGKTQPSSGMSETMKNAIFRPRGNV